MKKIFCIILGALLPLAIFSQNFATLWNKVEKAKNDNLPKSAITALDKIINTANRKGDNDQLAKALIEKMYAAEVLAPDSAKAFLPKVEQFCQSRKNAADKAVYQVLLGWLYNGQNIRTDPQARHKAIAAFRAATTEVAALAASRSESYLTLLNKSDDSHYYNHDLLSVIFPFVAKQLKAMGSNEADSLACQVMANEIEWYSAQQMREATMLAKIDSASILFQDNADFYRQIILQYGDLPVSAKAYAHLCHLLSDKEAYELAIEALQRHPKTVYTNTFKNILARMEQAVLKLRTSNGNTYPGESIKVVYSYNNVRNATLNCYRLPYSATSPEWLKMKEKDYPSLTKKPDFQQELPLRKGMPYDTLEDSITFSVPQPGIYLVEVSGRDFDSRYCIVRVSRLGIMQLPLPDEKIRVCVVDYKSGKPVPNSTIQLRINKRGLITWQKHTTNEHGELILGKQDGSVNIFASCEGDEALDPVGLERSYAYAWNRTTQSTYTQIYTDRAVYRPGQQVKIGGFIYNKVDDSTTVIADTNFDIKIYDANYKALQTITVLSDKLGAFSADFTLPQECLNGDFSIRSENGFASFRVEEYKRPKFQITLTKPSTAYTLGDTVMVSGEVKTYSGLPMANTMLTCTTERKQSWWLRYNGGTSTPYFKEDTVTTNADGRFELPVALNKPQDNIDNINWLRPLSYVYIVNARVTADDGETEESTLHLYASNTKAFVNIDLPNVICKEQMPNLTATQTNSMGEPVNGEGKYIIVQDTDTIQHGTLLFNQVHQLDFISQLTSGQYTLIIFPTNDDNKYHAIHNQFTLFSLADTKTVGTQPLQVWRSSNEFSYEKPIEVLVGTPLKEAWLHYDVVANGNIIDSQLTCLSDTMMRLHFDWKEKYNNGIHVLMALYHEGELHSYSFVLTKPLPDKKLQLRWNSFRDKLLPGSTESWTLQVLRHGKPAEASLVATMYDASLDKFAKHYLPFSLSFNRYIPQQTWVSSYRSPLYLNLYSAYKPLAEKHFVFTAYNQLFNGNTFEYNIYIERQASRATGNVLDAMPMMAMQKSERYANVAMTDIESIEEESSLNEKELVDNIYLRSDFSETAFFTSTLRTDANGQATIEFKLPESLTSWNFKALAHTHDLCYGRLDTMIIVQKPFMVEANMPRFLRSGDNTELTVTIRNNSAQPQSGKTLLAIIDAQNGEQLQLLSLPFNVDANQSTILKFPITVKDKQTMLICRYSAISDSFSDGEQQYIPVLTDLQKTINTVSFTLSDGQAHIFPLESLHYNPAANHSLLTIEYIGNPAWSTISALPSTVNYQTRCATQLAINYSALTMMRQILVSNPQLNTALVNWKQTDSVPSIFAQLQNNPDLKITAIEQTPWVRSAEREQGRLDALLQDEQTLILKQASMLHKLREMQADDGGWQWFPGMPTSTWLTLDIADMLARTRAICPASAADIDPMLTAAMRYLDAKATSAANDLKRNKAKQLPTLWMRYLYVVAKTNGQFNTAACKYFIAYLQKSSTSYNLYNKAMAAVILQKAKLTKQAELTLKSLLEYTVSRSEMGRYFDSRRAPIEQSMYKIPTQVAAIEAVQLIHPQDKQILNEMRLWLLQSKHTQVWDEPLAATQAISCLLTTDVLATPTALPAQFDLKLANSTTLHTQDYADIDPFVQLGYIKATFGEQELTSAPSSLIVQPSAAIMSEAGEQDSPTAIGAAYLQSWQPAIASPASGTELSINWQLYKETGNTWQTIDNSTALHVGDRVKVRYNITAVRDFDFVALRDGRPACLEPTSTASGYNWSNGSYRSVEDNGTAWYLDHLSKGHHIIEEIYNVDRAGNFSSACPQVQCLYAPEFTARAKAITISVE